MSQARIYGICVVKNEDDIIAHSLTFAARFCERIFVIDNGSTDNTWNIVQSLAKQSSAIVPFEQTPEPFNNAMRAKVYNALHRGLSDDAWWLILDADEFLEDDPRAVVDQAAKADADTIKAWIIQFYFTEVDAAEHEGGNHNHERPIFDRRRYYRIDWQETRLFRNDPRRRWDPDSAYNFTPDWLTRVFSRRILIRHYQYRDPEQISKRLRLRHGHREFSHVQSVNWRDVIRDSRGLSRHREGAPWRFTPSGLLYFYRRSFYQRIRSACSGGAVRRVRRLVAPK